MKIAFVTPEASPLVRRTNLADLADSLPRALKRAGADVRLFLPRSRELQVEHLRGLESVGSVRARDAQGRYVFEIQRGVLGEVPVYLFQNARFFEDRYPYGDDEGPYADNWKRYAAFSRAVLESLTTLSFPVDLFHCVDWTTGLLPLFRKLEYKDRRSDHPAARAGTYFAIHNLAMQGSFEREILPLIQVPHKIFHDIGGLELGGRVNFLKAGAEFSTIIGTHSPGHARRIQEQDRGYGLEETFLRRKKELVGITNGIDYAAWNPATDPLLPERYSVESTDLAGKRKCKAALQHSLGLDVAPRSPVALMLGRFDADSGADLVAEKLTPILERNVEVVLMGAGRPDIHERFKTMESTFQGRCRVVDGYHANTAHILMGGADILLLPFHYHPGHALCAIGMRYGVVPIVYAKSGLEDLVLDHALDQAACTGFTFPQYSGDGLLEGIDAARKVYRDAAQWKTLLRRCMEQDFSWDHTAREYLKAYRRVTRRVRGQRAKP